MRSSGLGPMLIFVIFIIVCFVGGSALFGGAQPYPNSVPMTDPGQLQLVNPSGFVGNDQAYAQGVNVPNSQAYQNAQEANAEMIRARAAAEVAHAQACQMNPYTPECMPAAPRISAGTWFLIFVIVVIFFAVMTGAGRRY